MGKIQSHSYIGTAFESSALLLKIIENAPSRFCVTDKKVHREEDWKPGIAVEES